MSYLIKYTKEELELYNENNELKKALKRLYKEYKKLDKATYTITSGGDIRFYEEPTLRFVEELL